MTKKSRKSSNLSSWNQQIFDNFGVNNDRKDLSLKNEIFFGLIDRFVRYRDSNVTRN